MSHFWHPFSSLSSTYGGDVVIVERGEGYHVFDSVGRRYIDATASLWYCNVGHGRSSIVEAATRQMRKLAAYSTFGDLANRPVLDLAERLSELSPVAGSYSFFTSGGSDSIDTAIKLCLKYFQVIGKPTRRYVLSRNRSYHGMHIAGTSIAGIETNAEGYGELMAATRRVQWDSVDDLANTIQKLGPENVAAFVCEPVIGAGGILISPDGYFEQAQTVCREAGVLFIVDEVITGFGRTGHWFASQRFNIQPDLLVCAKGISSGYLPMGAVIVSPWIAEPWVSGDAGIWRHGYTYSGHATAAAVAIANLDVIRDEGLLAKSLELERDLAAELSSIADHELVSELRAGAGAMAAVQLRVDLLEDDPQLTARVLAACRVAGVMTRMLAGHAIHISPPLTIDQGGLQELGRGLREALDVCLEE